ncbi:MAG: polysaccharide pyruvyl transferase CsaB, partial [Armatimonadota bacterium]|nr:polysaccharide pyruvyl transferase CsaB [Armatimonadota bacterium]
PPRRGLPQTTEVRAGGPAILISGYYGFGNLGDEAVLAGMVQGLRARLGAVPLVVLSANPPATSATHGVEALPRGDLRAVLRTMGRCRLFLSGGGSLLQDATSARSALYYLGLLRLAQVMGLRTMVYAAGLGPLRRPALRALARRVLERAALVGALGVRQPPLLTADPAFLLHPEEVPPEVAFVDGPEALGVAVRPWRSNTFVGALGEALGDVCRRHGARVVVLPFHPRLDLPISRSVVAACGGTLVTRPLQPRQALALIARLQVVVGLRLHALMFAAAAGVPPVGMAYDPKVAALHRDLALEGPVPLDASAGTLGAAIDRAWEGAEALRPALLAAAARLRARAEVAAAEAARLFAAA